MARNENTSSTEFIDTWHVRDYLGSVRAVYDITADYVENLEDVILEQNDYHVFGGRIDSQSLPTWSSNRYRFNGKEQLATATADLGLTDYGARMYSQKLLRWTTPDPLADKYHSTSPYAFSGNNPVNYVDPDGKDWIQNTETGTYDWRDDIQEGSEVPSGYRYIGPTSLDILKHLNITTEYDSKNTVITSITGDLDKGAMMLFSRRNISAKINVKADISYNMKNRTAVNCFGKEFKGIVFSAFLNSSHLVRNNPYEITPTACFSVSYGNDTHSTIMNAPTSALYPSGTISLNGSVYIQANSLDSHLSFGGATICVGATTASIISTNPQMFWPIERLQSSRPVK